MPCVFPVISLKLLHLLDNRERKRKVIFKNSLSFSLGIISSLLILSLFLLSFRFFTNDDTMLTWGFQSQSAKFSFLLVVIFLVISCNLFGIFEFGVFLTKFGSSNSEGQTFISSFFNGVLVTITSTTCTAPFFGTALTAAFQAPIFIALLIFFFIGLGLSFPYLLVSNIPFFLKFLPRPGQWMSDFKKIVGFMLLFVALWFLDTFQQQAAESFSIALYSLGLIALALWIYGNYSPVYRKKITKFFSFILSISLILIAILMSFNSIDRQKLLSSLSKSEKEKLFKEKGEILWEKFSREALIQAQKNNRNIFVDFTASWCASCIFNEKFSINAKENIALFHKKNVLMMKADLTNYDKELSKALLEYGSSAVPLYLLYDKEKKILKKLPSLLTSSLLRKELQSLTP